MKISFKPYHILPFFMIALVLGILGGWIRMGWEGVQYNQAAAYHGLIMTGSFIGGLITLERTSTMKGSWWLLFPLACGLSLPFFLFSQVTVGLVLVSIGSLGLVIFCLIQLRIHEDPYWYVLLTGAILWLGGNIKLLLTDFVPPVVNLWIGFILFTILGERLELTRFMPVPKSAFPVLWFIFCLIGLSLFLPFHGFWGPAVYALGISSATIWFINYDVARVSVRKEGFFRYLGTSMLTAYGWLLIHAILSFVLRDHPLSYDIHVHTFFLGFAFSMIWAHAPIILPAIFKLKVKPYHPILWLFWFIFQLSLLARMIFSLLGLPDQRILFSMVNGISIVIMLLVTGITMGVMNRRSN